ncbi:MAG: hypothetical protein ACLFOC_09605 [Campylobacterales bacterium]
MIYILGFGKSIEDIQEYIGGVLIAAIMVALNYNSNIFAKIAMYIVSAISISSIYLVILIITLAIGEEL